MFLEAPFNYTGCCVNTITVYDHDCIPRQSKSKKIKAQTQNRGWVEGEHTPEEEIWDEDAITILRGIGPSKAKTLSRMDILTV